MIPGPTPPPAGRPDDWDVFAVPPKLAPIGAAIEIRPVGPNRPFAGGDQPELTAWIRIVGDDAPPDPARLVFLLDALAPSYAAVLPAPRVIPTVVLSAQPSEQLESAASSWVLLRARTATATSSGWVDEQIDAWDIDGAHLGTARQLRLARPHPVT